MTKKQFVIEASIGAKYIYLSTGFP